ncbi:helix-turn-helix transcriptional regulator [Pseudomonas paeninsulae]|uniref:helix-turn-helix transcriptional regulator n=1 Tax=Pseudomonas paeninsulae TaxID=3110772 RepID=UPI002D779F20|nr:helix-turn-helix domain-containing protein [Pseudomonas sp. IT1137]
MALYEPIFPARYAAPLLDFVRGEQLSQLQQSLIDLGINTGVFGQADYVLTMSQFDTVLAATIGYVGRSDLGFELGKRIKLDHHLALGMLLRQCATLDAVLRTLCRFCPLITTCFSLHYQRTTTHGEYVSRPAAYMSATSLRFFEELYAVSFHVECAAMLGQHLQPIDTYLSMEAPPHKARYRELKPGRFFFGALDLPAVRFVIPLDMLDVPLARPKGVAAALTDTPDQTPLAASPATLQASQQQLKRTVSHRDWIKLILREAESCQPTRHQIAALLNISPATLTRRLATEGTTLRALGIEIRHERALAMLQDPTQHITQIAYRLGYGDATNFTHAFRAVAGISPIKYRQQSQLG